jgi:replicative DNA helicase
MVQAFEDPRLRPLRPTPIHPRVPPHNLEAEESVLGAMLLSSDAAAAAMEIVTADDFYKPAHGHVFNAVLALFERGEPVDAVTVADELRRSGLLEAVGDPAILVSLQTNTPSIANVSHYARIVEEHALLRRLVGVAGEIAEIGFSVPEDVGAAVDEAETLVFNVAQRRTTESIADLKDLLEPTLERIEELAQRRQTVTGTATGYLDLDQILAGLQPSSLTIVGARPAMGKTAFALGMVAHVGINLRRPALLFSLEMGHLELTQRVLSSEARINAQHVRTGQQLSQSDWGKLGAAITRLSDARIFIDDNPNLTVMDIRARARRLRQKEGDLGLVVVDYLQLMTGRGKYENRQVEVAEISRGLKILARELEAPVVALSQLSRNLEARQDKRPMLSDLRESGSLEQDADVVLFIYREEQYDPDVPIERRGDAEIIVAKHRNGPTGSAHLLFQSQYARFDNAGRM